MNSLDDLKALLPPTPASRALPLREQHKADLLAVIAVSPGRALRGRARPGRPDRPRPDRRWLVAAASGVAVAVIGLLAVLVPRPAAGPMEPRSSRLTVTRHWIVPAKGLSSIKVVTTSGSITVTGDGSTSAAVTAVPRYQGNPPTLTSHVADGRLTITTGCLGPRHCEVSLTLDVPAGLPITAQSGQGDIRLTGLTDGVVAITARGTIDLSGITGPVTARARQGTINAVGLAAKRASLSTDRGNINALFWTPPLAVIAATREGSVDIRLPSTVTYDVIARAGRGRTSVAVPESVNSAHRIDATSTLGSVTVAG